MKKYAHLLILILSGVTLISCKGSAVFDTEARVKVLYQGIRNEVYIRNPDIRKIKFSSDKADISILNDTTLLVFTRARGRADLQMEYKGNTRVLPFRVHEIPKGQLTFRGRVYNDDNPMPVNHAVQTTSVQANLPDFTYNCVVEVISMDILLIRDNEKVQTFKIVGTDLKGTLLRARAGDTYVFSNIKLQIVGGDEFKGADTVLKISAPVE